MDSFDLMDIAKVYNKNYTRELQPLLDDLTKQLGGPVRYISFGNELDPGNIPTLLRILTSFDQDAIPVKLHVSNVCSAPGLDPIIFYRKSPNYRPTPLSFDFTIIVKNFVQQLKLLDKFKPILDVPVQSHYTQLGDLTTSDMTNWYNNPERVRHLNRQINEYEDISDIL